MNDRWANSSKTPEMVRIAQRFRRHVQTAKYPFRRIARIPCAVCVNPEVPSEGHHFDYSRPFAVVWLCRTHHRQADHGSLKIKQRWICDYSSLIHTRKGGWHENLVSKKEEAPF